MKSRAIAQNLYQRMDESPRLGMLDHIILSHSISSFDGKWRL